VTDLVRGGILGSTICGRPVVRAALARDFLPITTMLAETITGSRLARWIDPVEWRRPVTMLAYVGDLAQKAIASRLARVATAGGHVIGASLWSPCGAEAGPLGQALEAGGVARMLTEVNRRQRILDAVADDHRPSGGRWHRLTCLGVRPAWRGLGVGSELLTGHHAFLNITTTPALVVTVGNRQSTWFKQRGYSEIEPPQTLSGDLPVHSLWRPPSLTDTVI
jgi:GNAT superfamily N-acetyltransferase